MRRRETPSSQGPQSVRRGCRRSSCGLHPTSDARTANAPSLIPWLVQCELSCDIKLARSRWVKNAPFATRDGLPLPIRSRVTVHRAERHSFVSLVVFGRLVDRESANQAPDASALPRRRRLPLRRYQVKQTKTTAPLSVSGAPPSWLVFGALSLRLHIQYRAYRPLAARSACPSRNQRAPTLSTPFPGFHLGMIVGYSILELHSWHHLPAWLFNA